MPELPSSAAAESEKGKTHLPTGSDHWQMIIRGHGTAYFRELVVEYKTLQWLSPFSAEMEKANREVADREKDVSRAQETLLALAIPEKPAVQKLLDDAKISLEDARQAAAHAAERKQAADNARVEAGKIIDRLIERFDAGQATWADLLEFESALLRLLPYPKLKSRYESLALEYTGVTGQNAPAAPADEQSLRATAETVLGDLHWAYTTAPLQEEVKSKMVVSLVGVTSVTVLAAVCVARSCECWVLPWVAVAGAMGAAMSAFQRVQSRHVKGDALTNCGKFQNGTPWLSRSFIAKLWSWISGHGSFALAPVIGAVFAVVMANILAAKLVSGVMFPTIPSGTNAVSGTNSTAFTQPQTNNTPTTAKPAVPADATKQSTNTASLSATTGDSQDAAKTCKSLFCDCWRFTDCGPFALLLVWAFAAGFSERLVPDIISRVTERTAPKS